MGCRRPFDVPCHDTRVRKTAAFKREEAGHVRMGRTLDKARLAGSLTSKAIRAEGEGHEVDAEGGAERAKFLKSRGYGGTVGSRLHQARVWSGLQYGDVAEALCVDRELVRKVEKGKWLPTVWELVMLSELYGCSVDWVLGLSDDPKTRAECVAAAQGESLEPVSNVDAIEFDRSEAERVANRKAAPESRESRIRMCTSKRRFRNETAAIKAAIGSSRHYGKPMRVYRCPVCRGWHLTSHELLGSKSVDDLA